MRSYKHRSGSSVVNGDFLSNTGTPSGRIFEEENILKTLPMGTVHPFHKSHTTVVGYFQEEFRSLFRARNVQLSTVMIFFNLLVYGCLLHWSSSTNSLALKTYSLITLFDALVLFITIFLAWVSHHEYKATTSFMNTYTLGFERFKILCVFSCAVTVHMGAVFIIKESIRRISDQPEVHAGRLLPGALLALLLHIILSYCIVDHPFKNICEVAPSSWLQEHVADMSKCICGMLPLFKSLLLPRVNPFFLLSCCAACGVLAVDLLLQIDSYYIADSFVGLGLSIVAIGTMWPITAYSGKVLLHSTPPYLLGQLDKVLSEAQTLDGVLEIKSEKFYTLKSGERNPTLMGSLQVRVRRDADEQMVLAHLKIRFAKLVPMLTIQVVKDGWTGNSHASPLSVSVPIESPQPGNHISLSGAYISGFNKPAAAVAPYLQVSPESKDKDVTVSPKLKGNHSSDFSFSLPVSSSSVPSIMKPRSSHSDIAKMYKAAGFKLPQTNFQTGIQLKYGRSVVKPPNILQNR